MDRFCDELRAERERQGLSLEAISWSTKIAGRYLQALESGEFGRLPGGVFRKGFFRSYLNALHLREAVWVPRFEAELRAAGVGEPDPAAYEELARNIKRARGGSEPDGRLRWSGVLAMMVLLLAFGWCMWHFALADHVHVAKRESTLRMPAVPAGSVRAVPWGVPADAGNHRSGVLYARWVHRFARSKRAA